MEEIEIKLDRKGKSAGEVVCEAGEILRAKLSTQSKKPGRGFWLVNFRDFDLMGQEVCVRYEVERVSHSEWESFYEGNAKRPQQQGASRN